ncbi:MAG: phosphoglucosamine mutase [Planctomycetota bacterium]|nr:phosphoglucosamine mutase [Planctomycetota bacterium]MDP6940728.1 phosphoglucosamine mutase [Planctomycetota bacterium]
MTQKLFGTDGMRGVAGEEPLTQPTLERLGLAIAHHLREGRVLVGHDGRESGETIAAAMVSGLNAGGIHADVVGLAPTPGIAFLTSEGPYAAGVVVSASHNPAKDNGIKLLNADGSKMNSAEETKLETLLTSSDEFSTPGGGECRRTKGMLGDYVAWLRNDAFPQLDLAGWKIALDCANGACSQVGPRVLKTFGAEVVTTHDRPDGMNINEDCGALHPEVLAALVKQESCAFGLCLDGDGDRGILADSSGRILDGDAILAGLCSLMTQSGELADATVVATVMSNLALENWVKACGAKLHRTPVGDRHVAAALRENNWNLGGEKSGHLLFGKEHGFRGDGLYTLLRVLSSLQRAGAPAEDFAKDYVDMPQDLWNLPAKKRVPLDELTQLSAEMEAVDSELQGRGRTVVRFSGTELKLRLMAEAEGDELVQSVLERLRAAAQKDGILAET